MTVWLLIAAMVSGHTAPVQLGMFFDYQQCLSAAREIEHQAREWTGPKLAAMCAKATGVRQ